MRRQIAKILALNRAQKEPAIKPPASLLAASRRRVGLILAFPATTFLGGYLFGVVLDPWAGAIREKSLNVCRARGICEPEAWRGYERERALDLTRFIAPGWSAGALDEAARIVVKGGEWGFWRFPPGQALYDFTLRLTIDYHPGMPAFEWQAWRRDRADGYTFHLQLKPDGAGSVHFREPGNASSPEPVLFRFKDADAEGSLKISMDFDVSGAGVFIELVSGKPVPSGTESDWQFEHFFTTLDPRSRHGTVALKAATGEVKIAEVCVSGDRRRSCYKPHAP